VAVDTPVPSPFCHEILNANPYAYLDDAPLEERRARAVEMRRSLPPELADAVGALDPAAIAEVSSEAWPVVRDPDDLHDALLTLVWVPLAEAGAWAAHAPALVNDRRLLELRRGETVIGWMPMEYHSLARLLFPQATVSQAAVLAESSGPVERSEALDKVTAGWMESTGPTTAGELKRKDKYSAAASDRFSTQHSILSMRARRPAPLRPLNGAIGAYWRAFTA
jgi:ATP-dependent Lhr-like helicase